MKYITFLIILFISQNTFAWSLFGNQTFDECILENMKGVTSDVAASSIRQACREKTKGSVAAPCKDRLLTNEELAKLTIAATLYNNLNSINFEVYNGNRDIEIKEINITISASNIKIPQEYVVPDLFTRPLSKGMKTISAFPVPAKDWGWGIISATTCSRR